MKKLIYTLLFMILCNISYAATEISTAGTNLGIGTTSTKNALSINNSLAIGSATYTSTTAPTNGLIIEGNVGIGSLSPGTALDVNGTVRATTFTGNGAIAGLNTNFIPKSVTSSTVGNSLIFDDGTNVGIGTTTPLAYFNISSTAAQDLFRIDDNGSVDITPLIVAADGNVGIGTVQAFRPLNVATTNPLVARFESTSASGTGVGTAAVQILTDDGAALAAGDKFSTLDFAAANDAAHTIKSSAGFSVYSSEDWTGSSTPSRLDLETTATGSTSRSVRMTINGVNIGIGTAKPSARFEINNNQTTSPFMISNNTSQGNAFYISGATGNGNVGIGTFVPGSRLSVSGGVGIGTGLNSSYAAIAAPLGGIIVEGNVGIGSLSPGVALDITGTIRASTGTGGQATCWKTDKSLGQCTSVVGAGGGCTCS